MKKKWVVFINFKNPPIVRISSASTPREWMCGKLKLHKERTKQENSGNDTDRLFIRNKSIKENRGVVRSLSEITEIDSQTCENFYKNDDELVAEMRSSAARMIMLTMVCD